MGLWDKLTGELVDIVEWLDTTSNTMVYRFERYQNEIKNGAKLVVREGQVAALVSTGQLADVYPPGTHTLETKNMPILSTLLGWKYGFNSPFKAEVYFVSTRRFTDLKWGTKNPIMLRDAEFGPVRLRAFGTYETRVKDAGTFLKQIVRTDNRFTTEEIADQLRNLIVSRFADIVGEAKIPALDLAANYEELGNFLLAKIRGDFEGYGLELCKLLVENVSLPEEVEKALDKRTSMGVIGDLGKYAQYQAAEAMQAAAQNPGGAAGAGIGLGAGFAMARQMGAMIQQSDTSPAAPPPLPQALQYYAAIGGPQAGPFDAAALQAKVHAGEITRDTLVWKQGMGDWMKAGEVAELARTFAKVPPPLPK